MGSGGPGRFRAAWSAACEHWEEREYTVFTENQNRFTLRGKTASLGGKPDLIARRGVCGTIIDVETGKPSPSHSVQVMHYMYAVPRALGQPTTWPATTVSSSMARWPTRTTVVDIPAAAVDEQFIGNLSRLIHRLGSGRTGPEGSEQAWSAATATSRRRTVPKGAADDRVEEGATEDF